ncbi:lysozyme inhibitor LprI family protein [Candidatus Nucleicultrix amoebiphila]|jgi:uncharacterized protein YecT (DUF1311 family)|uniref:Lysozyme inhibitor LprI-like N-terminal domain-containing protein n=1 Tax=Candidatus Nucleicultrix amoebiphila FS5 TaxID=1414854 RepID=A0A1W6N514_9PROT|nr:lysozyme inhibitor LprI family protein [Candidatus Nucleicultrix amoebiphila]ARN84858.1 hypothetical protein GQ61_05665 [Candidatus Nucleicultrix amoebiphila FS5]
MKKITLLLFFCLSCLSPHAWAQETQLDLTIAHCEAAKKADRDLNAVYHRILALYAKNKPFLIHLKKAQRAWVQFRDAHLLSIYIPEAGGWGSSEGMCRCIELQKLTEHRTKQLKEWLTSEEGDMCGGSKGLTDLTP